MQTCNNKGYPPPPARKQVTTLFIQTLKTKRLPSLPTPKQVKTSPPAQKFEWEVKMFHVKHWGKVSCDKKRAGSWGFPAGCRGSTGAGVGGWRERARRGGMGRTVLLDSPAGPAIMEPEEARRWRF